MSLHWPTMLARGEGGIEDLTIVIVLVVLAVGRVLYKKIKEKYDQQHAEQAEKEYEAEHRAQHAQQAQPARPPAPPVSAQTPSQRREAPPPQRQAPPRARIPPAPPRRRPPPPPKARPIPVPQPEEAEPPPEALGEGVLKGVGRLQSTLQTEEAVRRQRMAELPHLATRVRPGALAERRLKSRFGIDFAARGDVLKMIVSAEILGPPKALRDQPEPWEQ